MRFGFLIRPRAEQDLDEIGDYLAEEAGLDMGLQFLAEIYETLSLLPSHREIGWPCNVTHPQLMGARTFRVSQRFEKHLIFCQPYRDGIEVLRVLHASQDLDAPFGRQGVE